MELQFHKYSCRCMRRVKRQQQNQEQTQELRLPDGMPDIGSVLAAWGQVLLRGKEWRGGGMSVSGGVMAWVLYAPEDGSEPQCVETWIPFQMKWDFEDTQRDGNILTQCLLRSIDARTTSARKMMLRANIGVLAEAMVPSEAEVYTPGEVPEDVQLLTKTYPMRLPREAGEKAFELEEELVLPASAPAISQIVHYSLQPELIDRKVMAGKVVFRGMAIVHILYKSEDGGLHSWDFEVPFSQYGDLDGEYETDATATILPVLTALELESTPEGKLLLKCGMVAQYLVYDRELVALVEDAYSTKCDLAPKWEAFQMPVVLDETGNTLHPEVTAEAEGSRVAELVCYHDHAGVMPGENGMQIFADGYFQMLYYDPQGILRSITPRWEEKWELPMDENGVVEALAVASGKPTATLGAGNAELRCDVRLEATVSAQQGLEMASGLELGDAIVSDPNRPSLILCRAGSGGLWTIAKKFRSTVEAIRSANSLESDPDPDRLLLIPIQA